MFVTFLDHALGPVGVVGVDGGTHVIQADAVFVKRGRVDLHAHRGQRAAAHRDLPDAFYLRELLAEYGGGNVVHLPAIKGLRSERNNHDRRVRRVDLAIGWIARQAGGQFDPRCINGRLHLARRAIDIAA